MTTPNLDSYSEALIEQSAQRARREACRTCSSRLQDCAANVLWAFGLVDDPRRRALATILQIGGSIARGNVAMLEAENWYAAAALCRQLVEVEYLVWLFGVDPTEAEAWLSATQEDLRQMYRPSAMRKRSEGRFRDQEYWSHCELGGHPNPKAAFLLPEHILPDNKDPLPTSEWMWVDLGQHLERLWSFAEVARKALGLDTVRIVADARRDIENVLQLRHAQEACADRFRSPPE
jgi:hypothetical protein